MSAATAVLITGAVDGDSSYVERLSNTSRGRTGFRALRANTRDAYDAETAVGVPARGDPWGPGLPDLKADTIETVVLAGDTTIVSVNYREGDANAFDPPAPPPTSPGTKRTMSRPSIGTSPVRQDVHGDLIPGDTPVTIETSSLEYAVYNYVDVGQAPAALAAWKALEGPVVNADPLTLPNYLGGEAAVTIEPRRALIRNLESNIVDAENGVVELVLIVAYSRDWDAIWAVVNANQEITLEGIAEVYDEVPSAEIEAIWAPAPP